MATLTPELVSAVVHTGPIEATKVRLKALFSDACLPAASPPQTGYWLGRVVKPDRVDLIALKRVDQLRQRLDVLRNPPAIGCDLDHLRRPVLERLCSFRLDSAVRCTTTRFPRSTASSSASTSLVV